MYFGVGYGPGRQHYNVARVPVVKKQGISAYDPRVIEVTGVSMMVSAQGADHTAGNLPAFQCADKSTEEIVAASLETQALIAANDSLGLCIFGRSTTIAQKSFIPEAVNSAHGTNFDGSFFVKPGKDALKMEWEFNRQAGFTVLNGELPEFFFGEPLAPTNKTQRHRASELREHLDVLLEQS